MQHNFQDISVHSQLEIRSQLVCSHVVPVALLTSVGGKTLGY